MFEQDYLMRLVMQFIDAINRSMQRASGEEDHDAAARLLDDAIGTATDIDGGVLLDLTPDSMAEVLSVSGTDPRVLEYVGRSLLLSSQYWQEAGNEDLARLRAGQARSLASAYAFYLDEAVSADESMRAFLESQEEA